MSLLSQQLQAFRQKHGIPEGQTPKRRPAPSVLFKPREASQHDSDAFAALALRGIAGLADLDPDIASFSALFEGAQRDREMLSPEENDRLNREIRRMLLLLSPHLQTRAAQECLEGLLHRYHVHRWNVDDVLSAVLPYHDSQLFSTLLQGLHVEGKPRWSWLQTFKQKPATLVRAAFAKYSAKDIAVLSFVGDVVQETLKLQKVNRALTTFFISIWLSTLASVSVVNNNLLEAALPPVLAMLRKPHLRDSFHAGLSVAGALCVKAELNPEIRVHLMEKLAVQPSRTGELQRPVAALLSLLLQAQAVDDVPEKLLVALASLGPQAFAAALPAGLDCSNLLGVVVEACFLRAVTLPAEDPQGAQLQVLAGGILANHALVDRYHAALCASVLQAFVKVCIRSPSDAAILERAAGMLKSPVSALGERQPLALSAAFRQAVNAALERKADTGPLVKLLSPVVPAVGEGEAGGELLPVMQGFEHSSAKIRAEAVQAAAASLERDAEGDAPRERLLASLLMEAVSDRSAEVAQTALSLKGFWSSSPHTAASKSAPALVRRLSKLLAAGVSKGSSLQDMFASLFPPQAKVTMLAPQLIRTLARVYMRADCETYLRQGIDAVLLPFVILCLVCKDGGSEAAAVLWPASLGFVKVAGHAMLTGLKQASTAKAGELLTTAASTAGASASAAAVVEDLCCLVAAKPLPLPDDADSAALAEAAGPAPIGGAAAQNAAAVVLAAVLPGALETLSKASREEAERALTRGAESCQQLALHHRLAPEGENQCPQSLRTLVRALLAGAAALAAPPAARPATKRGKGDVAGKGGAQAAVHALMRVMLDAPRSLSAELGSSLNGARASLVRPALLRLALGPELPKMASPDGVGGDAGAANALLLLKSLVQSAKASDWPADQCLAVALVARAARATAPEVRSAAIAALESMRHAKWAEPTSGSCWETPCAKALQDAGVLRPTVEALHPKAWETADPELEITGMPAETMGSFIEHMVAHKGEVVLDSSAVTLALSKFLSKKGGKAARQKACTFWGTALAMLVEPGPLLEAPPPVGLLTGLREPLQKCSEEAARALRAAELSEAGARPPEIPEILFVAASALQRLSAGGAADAVGPKKSQESTADVMSRTVTQVVLPFLSAVVDVYEGGTRVTLLRAAKLCEFMCRSLAAVSAAGAAEETASKAMAVVFRLCTAASSGPTAVSEDDTPTQATTLVASSAAEALAEAGLGTSFLCQLCTDSVALKGKQLVGPRGSAAAELLARQVVTLGSLGSGAPELLGELARLAREAASLQVKLTAKAAADRASQGDALSSVLSALAALSEHLDRAGPALSDGASAAVEAACAAILEVCKTVSVGLSPRMLASVIRACGSLSSLASPATNAEGASLPLQACAEALRQFRGPLGVDALALLRGSFKRLWRTHEAEESFDDELAQSGLRQLLHAAFANRKGLTAETDRPLLLSLSHSAGYAASLDFAVLLLIARRHPAQMPAVPAGSTKRKGGARKRRAMAAEQEAAVEEAILGAPVQLGNADAVADEALEMLTSVSAKVRYQCLGTLAQSLCALAAALHQARRQQESGSIVLGRGLIPPEFLDSCSTAEQVPWILEVGLMVLERFLSQHGLPEDLDSEGPVKASMARTTAFRDDLEAESASAASALCYATWCTCAIEVFLNRAAGDADDLSACRTCAKGLLSLLLRSLAVNHPLTFFHAVCLTLRVPEFSPPVAKGDALANTEVTLAGSARIMAAASAALRDRRELRRGALQSSVEDIEVDEESWAAHGEVCVAAARHVVGRFFGAGGKAHKIVDAEHLEVAWRFLDSLCVFSGKRAPEPVLELCLPAAASYLGGLAPMQAVGESDGRVAVACCTYVQTAVDQLGRGILAKLGVITPPLLDIVASTAEKGAAATENDKSRVTPLEEGAMGALCSLVVSVGPFLSPFLERLIDLCTALPATPGRSPLLDGLGRELVGCVPYRLLMPALSNSVTIVADAGGNASGSLEKQQRLAVLLAWLFSGAQPDALAPDADSISDVLLRLLGAGSAASRSALAAGVPPEELPARLFPRDAKAQGRPRPPTPEQVGCAYCGADGGVAQLFALASSAYAQFALRLDLDSLRPCFSKAISWARGKQENMLLRQADRKAVKNAAPDVPGDADDACRALALYSVMDGLVAEAPPVAEELLLPLVYKDLICCLGASRVCAQRLAAQKKPAGAKRKAGGAIAHKMLQDHTWWWFEVSTAALGFVGVALAPAGERTETGKAVDQAINELVDPCCGLLDVFSLLPALEDTPVSQQLLHALQSALVSLAAASDGTGMKSLMSSVLRKSNADDAETRLCAVKCCHKIWQQLGVQVVTSLTEVVMFASELLEDEDIRVENAVRALIKTMEECTGESLQDSLKR